MPCRSNMLIEGSDTLIAMAAETSLYACRIRLFRYGPLRSSHSRRAEGWACCIALRDPLIP